MIERTVLEIAQHRFWAWRNRHTVTPRRQLREADQLMYLIEECRVRRIPVPTPVWRQIVHLLGQVDTSLTHQLGIDRSVDRSADLLFEAEGVLMAEQVERRRPSPGKVVPLFPKTLAGA